MTWADVQALRKSGRFQEAIDIGLQDLANDPDDFKLRTQIDWAFYGLVKTLVSTVGAKLKASQPVPVQTISQIHKELRRFAKQPKRRPDNALSNIVREVCKIAPHFQTFPGFIRWVGNDGLGTEDWQYSQRDENRYPPIALGVARALAKWVIFAVAPGPRPDVDVRVANGHLRRNAKGFAFVDDGFVPPHLVESIPADVNDVAAVLVYAKHPKEERYGWRAVALSAG